MNETIPQRILHLLTKRMSECTGSTDRKLAGGLAMMCKFADKAEALTNTELAECLHRDVGDDMNMMGWKFALIDEATVRLLKKEVDGE